MIGVSKCSIEIVSANPSGITGARAVDQRRERDVETVEIGLPVLEEVVHLGDVNEAVDLGSGELLRGGVEQEVGGAGRRHLLREADLRACLIDHRDPAAAGHTRHRRDRIGSPVQEHVVPVAIGEIRGAPHDGDFDLRHVQLDGQVVHDVGENSG